MTPGTGVKRPLSFGFVLLRHAHDLAASSLKHHPHLWIACVKPPLPSTREFCALVTQLGSFSSHESSGDRLQLLKATTPAPSTTLRCVNLSITVVCSCCRSAVQRIQCLILVQVAELWSQRWRRSRAWCGCLSLSGHWFQVDCSTSSSVSC